MHLAHPTAPGTPPASCRRPTCGRSAAADTQVGRILDAVSADPRLRRHAAVVLTADHGGSAPKHTDPTKAVDYTVPFMVWGVGVAQGADLYALNARYRRDPGTGRPTYDGRQPVRNGELANLVPTCSTCPGAGQHLRHAEALSAAERPLRGPTHLFAAIG